MAGSVFFRVRGSRRGKRGRHKSRLYLVLILAAAVLAAGVLRLTNRQSALPVTAKAAQTEAGQPLWGPAVYLRILTQVIPGFGETVPGKAVPEAAGEGEQIVKAVGLANPRDPRQILAMQIPYMVEAGINLQPAVNSAERGGEEEEPKIVFPVNRRLNGQGTVLFYHVHTTESFVPTSGTKFTENLDLTVAHLGATLAAILQNNYLIPVIHDKTIHDIPRNSAYQTALPTIQRLLAENPEARLVIDLHRDGVARSVTTAQLEGMAAGRILFVVGSRHPGWQENYAKAVYLHERLEELAPGLSRGVRERPLVYNQHVHPGALLIEVGGHENSLEEALRSLPYLAEALAELYSSQQ